MKYILKQVLARLSHKALTQNIASGLYGKIVSDTGNKVVIQATTRYPDIWATIEYAAKELLGKRNLMHFNRTEDGPVYEFDLAPHSLYSLGIHGYKVKWTKTKPEVTIEIEQ